MKLFNYIAAVFFLITLSYCSPQSPPATAEGTIEGVSVSVEYSSPRVKGRQGKIWGDMLPYGEVWRAGANAATEVTFGQPVLVEGESLAAGTYSLFMIPGQESWQVIFNEATDISGTAYESVKEQNVLEVSVTPRESSEIQENLTYLINGSMLELHWEQLIIPIEIQAQS